MEINVNLGKVTGRVDKIYLCKFDYLHQFSHLSTLKHLNMLRMCFQFLMIFFFGSVCYGIVPGAGFERPKELKIKLCNLSFE